MYHLVSVAEEPCHTFSYRWQEVPPHLRYEDDKNLLCQEICSLDNWELEESDGIKWIDVPVYPESGKESSTPFFDHSIQPQGHSQFHKHNESVMVWILSLMIRKRWGLYFLPRKVTMNGVRYVTVLDDLMPYFKNHGFITFIHDSIPCHKTKKVFKLLDDHNITNLGWLGNCSDLNLTENDCKYMKKCLRHLRSFIKGC